MDVLKDSFGRSFSYLRLSVTDACNFRCTYCLPNGYQGPDTEENVLSVKEISFLAKAFAELGFWKIRLTGGEPTVRRDIIDIAQTVSSTPGIRAIALSTNAYRLKSLTRQLFEAGVRTINVSIDSLNPERFHQITGHNKLSDILEAIDLPLSLGMTLKVNVVLMKGVNDQELPDFLRLAKTMPISVRFIELMGTGCNRLIFEKRYFSGEVVKNQLENLGWIPKTKDEGSGPAINFKHPDYHGTVGIISPYSKDFCSTCNRLRITSRGALRLCLFSDGNLSLRHLLQHDDQREEMKEMIRNIILQKDVSHFLQKGRYGNAYNLAAMGG
ncbi:MAG TPA: GTP 3',8-cyclase MoaA [Bdellovibrionota bacterium]|nr:GTP 3',8-cyclase MoaA [Bdellovibrionota bacterium]